MSDTSDISDGQDQMFDGRFHKFIEYIKSIRWLSGEPWKFFAYTAMKFTYIFYVRFPDLWFRSWKKKKM